MTTTTLAQSDGYSGASRPGLNENGSYHRMIYENRENILSLSRSKELISDIYQKFLISQKSRLVIRILVNLPEGDMIDFDRFISGMGGTFGMYHNYQPNSPKFTYLTISFNRADRDPQKDTIRELTRHNQRYVGTMTHCIGNFEEFNLQKLHDFHQRGFSLTNKMNSKELVSLWGDSFGWSEKACEDLLASSDGSFPLGVRSKTRELIAVVLYSNQPHHITSHTDVPIIIQHGETTEASTLPEYQGNGIMPVLVTGLHSYLLNTGINNVYGELRAEDITGDKPNSINHGTKSGKIFHFHQESSNLLINHVSISGKDESYNTGRVVPGYTSSPPEELRSFLIGSMDPSKLTQKIRSSYIKAINS